MYLLEKVSSIVGMYYNLTQILQKWKIRMFKMKYVYKYNNYNFS